MGCAVPPQVLTHSRNSVCNHRFCEFRHFLRRFFKTAVKPHLKNAYTAERDEREIILVELIISRVFLTYYFGGIYEKLFHYRRFQFVYKVGISVLTEQHGAHILVVRKAVNTSMNSEYRAIYMSGLSSIVHGSRNSGAFAVKSEADGVGIAGSGMKHS
jgi:hypothetical protein